MAFSSSLFATAYPWLHRLPPRAPEEASWRHAGGCAGAWVQSGSGPPASTLSGSSSCRVQKLVAHRTLPGHAVHRGKFLEVPWLAFPASSSCRGQLPLCARAPAHPPACRPEAFSGACGGSLCSQGYAVASGDEEEAIVANGGAPNGHFLHCLGNSDGHSMTLSPAVRVR